MPGTRGTGGKDQQRLPHRFGGNRYSVPHFYAGQDARIRVAKGVYITIVSNVGTAVANVRASFHIPSA
jgi:hypothetical protein